MNSASAIYLVAGFIRSYSDEKSTLSSENNCSFSTLLFGSPNIYSYKNEKGMNSENTETPTAIMFAIKAEFIFLSKTSSGIKLTKHKLPIE